MQYVSKSQQARVVTEAWVAANGYCLACESDSIRQTKANTQARDFECISCGHPYELKSCLSPFGNKIVDGAYASMIRRIEGGTVPSILLMRYSVPLIVVDLVAIHRSLITREVIQERKPLSESARRAGWVGCNILLSCVPPEGRISLVDSGAAIPREDSRARFKATSALADRSLSTRSWSRALLECLHRLQRSTFTLEQVYSFEAELSLAYPENRNVRAKIRQQLQVLRDAGLLAFEGRGTYRLVFGPRPSKQPRARATIIEL
jgi:type II restriction enzyme